MITGYNTDVRRGDVVLHVQTEDKGLANPSIESVIYVAGQVLAARRASYAALLAEGKGERDIAAMMDHQHRTIIAAIRAGRFDDKVGSFVGGRSAPAESQPKTLAAAPAPPPPPKAATEPAQTLDQVILDYLSTESEHEQLVLVLGEGSRIVPGERNFLTVRASSSRSGDPVPGAQVTVKILSTVAEPRTIVAGETDRTGRLDIGLDIPRFDNGTGALIITAVSSFGRAEIKSLL